MSSLDESLALALPALAPVLLPEEERPAMLRLARTLAPIHCAGFECRLAADAGPVDLQQRVLAGWGEPRLLAATLAARGLEGTPVWDRLVAFCRRWDDPVSFLRREVRGCWMEFDQVARGQHEPDTMPPIPSIFLSFGRRHESATDAERLVGRVVELLTARPPPEPTLATVRRCAAVAPGEATVTDVGLMLSRRVDGLRLVVGHVPRPRVVDYLDAVDWPGHRADVAAAMEAMPPWADPVAVSLDVAGGVGERIGLEYFPGAQPRRSRAWSELLDRLTSRALCRPDEAAALLAWPGRLHPPEVVDAWPWTLVVDSILGPSRRFSVLERRLNHVKLVCGPGRSPTAKAYLGFGALWLEPESPERESLEPGSPRRGSAAPSSGPVVPGARDVAERCEIAAARAASFLMEARDEDGWWRDFPRVMEGSDEWVTSYVGTCLADVGADGARAAATAWRLLAGRRAEPGWGYNEHLPVDADATAWALRLAARLGELESSPARSGLQVLLRHRRADGGFASYNEEVVPALAPFLGGDAGEDEPGPADADAYLRSHACVTAAVAALDRCRDAACRYLRAVQAGDGHWDGYWWCDPEYATVLSVEALLASGATDDAARLRAAQGWAARRLEPGGYSVAGGSGRPSAFATALCLRALAAGYDGPPELLRRGLAWLLERQDEDGGWPASALMRVPPPHAADPDEHPAATFVGLDDRRIFTTATVLAALSEQAVAQGSGPE